MTRSWVWHEMFMCEVRLFKKRNLLGCGLWWEDSSVLFLLPHVPVRQDSFICAAWPIDTGRNHVCDMNYHVVLPYGLPYISTHAHTHTHTLLHTHTHTFVRWMCTRRFRALYVYTPFALFSFLSHPESDTHTRTHTHTRAHAHTHTHTQTPSQTHIFIDTDTHTDRHRHRNRHGHRHRYRHRHRNTHKHRHTHKPEVW